MTFALLLVLLLGAAAPAAWSAPEPPEYAGMLDAHNRWRRPVGSPDLTWSHEAAVQAQAWANQLAANECQAHHSTDAERREKFGENIYYYWLSRPYQGWRRDATTVVDSWGREIEYYDELANACHAPEGKTCHHYTQVVWSRTLQLGCGRARCPSAEVWVCEYSPRGNIVPVRPYELRGVGTPQPLRPVQAPAATLSPVPAAPAAPLSPVPAAPAAAPPHP